MQDEHEKGKNGVGVARPGASAYEECREPEPRTDPGVSQVEPGDRVCRVWTSREVCVGGGGAEGAELRQVEQAGARCSASVRGKSDGDKHVADDAINPRVSRSRHGAGSAVPTASVWRTVYGRGHRSAGRSGPGARAIERPGHAPHSSARVRAVWEQAVRAAGQDQCGASVQLASQRALPQSGGGVGADAAHGDRHWRAAQARPARTTRIPARGHGASGRLGWSQGRVSHQCGRYRDAMASGGMHEQDQRGLLATGAGGSVGAVPVYGTRVSRRQRAKCKHYFWKQTQHYR
jgi:hypothetical protein